MIGLVIVSHSARLAEGVAELVRGMGGPEVPVRAAGGLDAPDHPLGTDALRVLSAIEEVYSDEGVLVLMDLGSAVLSAETALDLLPPERRARVALCEAPVVEGAVSAAVQARLGGTLERALAEARGALAAKRAQLGEAAAEAPAGPAEAAPAAPAGDEQVLRLTVRNRLGLHARPAARLVQAVGAFAGAQVRVQDLTTGRGPVSARSINAVTTLAVRQGHELQVSAAGPQAAEALAAVRALAEADFGDVEPAEAPAPAAAPAAPAPEGALARGVPASPGIGIGPARRLRPPEPAVPTGPALDRQADWAALGAALERTRVELRAARDTVARRADPASAAILEAHLLSLEDEALLAPARAAILEEGRNAAAAWRDAFRRVAGEYRALDDEYLRARAADVEDVGRQVLLQLAGGSAEAAPVEAGVVVAADLDPAAAARLDPERIQGVVTARGGATSHAAILARALGIPTVVGAGEAIMGVAEGTLLLVDGQGGCVWADPPPTVLADYRRRADVEKAARAAARAASAAPAVTRDGLRIEVAANAGSLADARAAAAAGAEGVGLLRSEFLFLDRRTAPGEEEQVAAYRAVAEALRGRPLVVRTLDAGGDKPLPYLDMGHEQNPFLGWRAIRICLAMPELFKVQLRALVRVAAEHPVRVMFPMIATVAEWRAARALLEEARREVQARSQAVPDRIETGMMVEVPAAALQAGRFAPEVDFFSIGTNDLTQYTLAAERGNPRLAALSSPLHPAVLELVARTVAAAHAHGRRVAVCGELAGEAAAVPLLVGLGVDELSMAAPAIPRAKQLVRGLDGAAARELARRALALESAEEVQALLGG